jgi:GH24 family phage-related lysozyme (muramidase)
MKLHPAVIAMIVHHEGVRYKPYRCPAHLWTIGVGHVLYPEQGKLPVEQRKTFPLRPEHARAFTKEEVNQILERDLRRFIVGVERYCPTGLNEGRMGALVSFAFNVGLGMLQRSTLRQKHNRGDYAGAAEELLKFTKAAGRVLPGLVKRRNDEKALYLSESK